MSLTYTAILASLLAHFMPLEQAGPLAEALVMLVIALAGLYGRYRLGDVTLFGKRKQI